MEKMCEGCEQFIEKIELLNAELRTLRKKNGKQRNILAQKDFELQKLRKQVNGNKQHFRNNRKKDRSYNKIR